MQPRREGGRVDGSHARHHRGSSANPFVLVFWRGFGAIWTLFLQSLETWQVDLEVSLTSVWEQVQDRGFGDEGYSADDLAERLLSRLLLGWAGMAALFEIVFS